MPLSQLMEQLQSSPEGLDAAESERRRGIVGPNALQGKPPPSLWALIAEQLDDRLVQILLLVAVVSAVLVALEPEVSGLESFLEPLIILTLLIVNASVGVWQSQSAQTSLDALQAMQALEATVQRPSSGTVTVPSKDLVPGDVVQVRVGDAIPADGRILAAQRLFVDEGSLTGESVTVEKYESVVPSGRPLADQSSMVYSGTLVTSGTATVLVVRTGLATEFGQISQGVALAEPPPTPLALQLQAFGSQLTWLIGLVCFSVWLVSIPKMNDPSFDSFWQGAIYYAKVAVALGVAAIPEGLPAVITLCLSLGTRRMAERKVIVRKLQSVETLGCTSVICTDKTGTLTTNEMTVVQLVLLEHDAQGAPSVAEHVVEGFSYSPMGEVEGVLPNVEVKDNPLGSVADVAAVSALCNDAMITGNDVQTQEGSTSAVENEKIYERIGEPTEAALCVLAEKLGGMSHYLEGGMLDRSGLHVNVPPSVLASANVQSWRQEHPRMATLDFNRDRKSMSVLCRFPHGDYPSASAYTEGVKSRKSGNRLLVKGAPNLLLERCTHVKFRDGTVAVLTGDLRRNIEEKVTEMAARPLRCLALAVKEKDELESSLKTFEPKDGRSISKHPLLSDPDNFRDIESGLTLVGIVGIKDPARPEVADSILQCTKAGIRVMMITGDARDTAIAIAKDVNIFPKEDVPVKAFEGREFFELPEKQQLEILKEDNIVFCRAEPADKQQLVRMLQSLNEIPAMTGDGVNDAPALQQAAIGVAMGITGTEVSKEAADMILADDNFSTIVNAVEEGRRIYANMQAFICFLISCNIGEICAIFFATLAGFPEPLTAMHLLWVNLVTDGPPATALGFNPPSPNLMEEPPRPSNEPIMTQWLLIRYCVTGLYVGLATIGVFAQHYLDMGLTMSQLTSWSQCGEFWLPSGPETCADLFQGAARRVPQSLALTTLVCMEMLKALSAVSVDSSLLQVGPQSNPWLILGVSGPFLLHLAVLYSDKLGVPVVAESFGLTPLTWEQWQTVLLWAMPILLVDEVLKAIGRSLQRRKERKASVAAP